MNEAEWKAEREAIDVKRWGQCPYYKGHFDVASFVAGCTSALFISAMIAIAMGVR